MNFLLSVDNEKLNLKANKNKVTQEQINAVKNNSEIINFIKTRKDELIRYISNIPKVSAGNQKNVVSIYRLSGLQEGMLFHSLYNEQFGNYVEQFTCDIVDADLNVLKAAWAEIIAKHTILRTGFYYESFSIPVQCVYRDVTLPVTEIDYRELEPASQTAAFNDYLTADRERGFDFNQPPLMRITLFQLNDNRYRMLWSFHHILFDGWSLPVLMNGFLEAYELLIQGQAVARTPEDKYEDFIRYLERRDKWAEESYWRGYLRGITEGTSLPFVKKTNAILLKAKFLSITKAFDKNASEPIYAYAKRHRITLNTLMQGVWALLLNRYTANDDVLFGTVVSGRPDELPGVEHRVGLFINTIPFKATFDNQEVATWLQGLQADQAASRNYQHATLQSIKEWTGIKADLFDSLLVFENYPVNEAINAKQWSLKVENANTYEQTNYPLTILIADAYGLNFTFNYNADLLETSYVQSIVDQFAYVLKQIIDGAAKNINDISTLTPAEVLVLNEFNNTVASYPANENIVSLFEAQVEKTPDAVALLFNDKWLTYSELNRRSNQLARYLQLHGVTKETLVPICLERSFEMLIGILGILKAGAAYIPVDPEYPVERIAYMLDDSAAKIVLSSAAGISKLQENTLQVIELDKDWESISSQDHSNLDTVITTDQLAYVIYTSGSTGKPKGAMNEHGGVVNRLTWTQSYFGLTAADTILQKNTFSFDVSVWELLWPVLTGAKLVFAKPGAQGDSLYLKSIIESQNVTLLHFVPSMLSVFLLDIEKGDCPELKHVLCSGEALTTAQVKLFRNKLPHVALHNLYGPTEAAIDVTYWSDLEKDPNINIVPIGKPVWNTQIHIRDKSGELSPIGVPGEICIGGVQVARGYLNQPALTKEKFITDPYREGPNARLYRTGDQGRWLADGNIEYLGRIDDQVKIRGYRIELGEIEQVLQQHENVRQTVVLAKADKQGTKRLSAYVVMEEAVYDKQKLQDYLSERLPEYMVPRLWVRLDSLPLTPNGKTDKKALPEAEAGHEETYTAPETGTEKQLAKIWEELLGVEQVGTGDNFFELGGHSLLAMRVISQVRRELNKELKIRDLFVYPTIAELSKQLEVEESTTEGTIQRAEPRPEYIPLSYSQERLWFIDRLEGSIPYHISAVLKLQGNVNTTALEKALKTVAERHEILRTVIREHEGQGYQYIKANNWSLKQSHLNDSEAGLQDYIAKETVRPFDLSQDDMLRAELIVTGQDEYVLLLMLHHIVADGWSMPVLVSEFSQLYNDYNNNKIPELKAPEIQYADYAIWQRAYLNGEKLQSKLAYWQDKLAGTAMLELPADHARGALQSNAGAIYEFTIGKEQAARLQKISLERGATLYMTLLSVFKVLLYRYSGQEDICVGTPVANRDREETAGLIGFFVNTLALRTILNGEETFTELLSKVKQTTLEAYGHQEVPFEKVVEAVVKERDLNRGPLFQVMFALQNTGAVPMLELGDIKITSEKPGDQSSKYDLSYNAEETKDGIHIVAEYNTDLYEAETIARMAGHYEELIKAVTEAPATQISKLQLLSIADEQQLQQFNETTAEYPKTENIISLFEAQAKATPESTALVFEGETVSYNALNEQANKIAHYLQEQGVTKETPIAICIERGINMIAGILGILKAGAAYVPVDIDYPKDRISYILEDTKATIILSSSTGKTSLTDTNTQVIELDNNREISNQSSDNLDIIIEPNQLAYIMYTSGSTGKPKGVMVEHQNIINYTLGFANYFGITAADTVLQQSSVSFDTMCEEVYPALISGAKVVMVKEGGKDVDDIIRLISKESITILSATPTVIAYLNKEAGNNNVDTKKLRYIISGGELLQPGFIDNLYPTVTVVNSYGPTEGTVCATYYTIGDINKAALIGKPVSNTQIYIRSASGELSPVGVPGEICIGGVQVARGYLNQPELTKEKFIADAYNEEPNAKLYRTGDQGRWLADGNIEYLGRIDDQVKIRGYRIEPGEIEQVLLQHENVRQAVVLAKADKQGTKRLTAYVVMDETAYEKQELQNYLGERLPEYMVPRLWVNLQSLPLTPNGKTDKRALPEAETSHEETYTAPQTTTEKQLAKIWEELLGVEKVGTKDNFFELGGHSLLAMRVISQVRKELNKELKIRDLFMYPVIADLAKQLEGEDSAAADSTIKSITPRPEYIPLSYSQERLWFIDRLEGSVQYHIPGVLKLKGDLDAVSLERAIREVVDRHEVLRTVIREHDGRSYQFVKPAGQWKLLQTSSANLKPHIAGLIEKPFDLSADDMLRAELIQTGDNSYVLVMVIHHIASDAWSLPIIVDEIATLYSAYSNGNQLRLPEPVLQFADYALWQRDNLLEEKLEEKLQYWKSKLQDVPALQLPADYIRPTGNSSRGATLTFNIDQQLSNNLQLLSQEHGVTLYMTLLSAFNVLMYRYSGQDDICVGTSIAGRPNPELERLIGFFVNTLALRNQVKSDEPFTKLLAQVKQTTLEAYEHQEVPFEKVVEAVVKERTAGLSPLFQVMLVLGNTPTVPELKLSGLQFDGYDYEQSAVKFDLTFFVSESPDGLQCAVQYKTDVFSAVRIETMVEHFCTLLASAVAEPAMQVGKLQMLSQLQKESLLSLGQSVCLYPTEQTIADIFEAVVLKASVTNAITFEGQSISFDELNKRSNRLARHLQRYGVGADTLVPLYIERGISMIVGIMGILKSGGAYVPVDTDYPAERINFILEDTNAKIAVSSPKFAENLSDISEWLKVVELDEQNWELAAEPETDIVRYILPDNLAYVIYTSGSTGKPKGVKITQRNIIDYVYGLHDRINIGNCKTFGLMSTIATDLGNTVLFSSLLFGRTLHVFSKETLSHIEALHTYFDEHRIDCIKIVPSHWKALSADEPLVPARMLVFGGESLSAEIVSKIRQYSDCRIINHYGPTETTIGKLLYEVTDTNHTIIPIGRPFSNTQAYVLNKDLQLCPVGVPGQLLIGGVGLSAGYQGNMELTQEKFITNPYSNADTLMYQTGDAVQYNAEGNIVYLGRVDDQVKIRGYRVEPGEISRILEQSKLVSQAVVMARRDKQGSNQLVGYVIASGAFDRPAIVNWLKEQLPEYMVPAHLIELKEIPLTAAGKINRKLLPDPETEVSAKSNDAPVSEAELKLTTIWQDILEIDSIGVHDDFFELGGHSLLAVRLISAVRKAFMVELPISDVFDFPTVSKLSSRLNISKPGKEIMSIGAQLRPQHIPLSFSQERMWFIDRLEGSVQYHVPAVLRLTGKLNIMALTNAFREIVNRHEVLRTVIREHEGRGYQYIKPGGDWLLGQISREEIENSGINLQDYIQRQINKPFNLSQDDMLRAELIQTDGDVYILVLTMHHIASDGWSTSILVHELSVLYNAFATVGADAENQALAALPIQYADYAIWQRNHLQGNLLEQKLNYWKDKLEGVSAIQLPTDYRRPAIRSNQGLTEAIFINKELVDGLNALSRKQGTTLYMTLLSAFMVLLYRYSGQQDISVGTPVSGRSYQEIEGLIGFFINTLVLRNNVQGTEAFTKLLEQVKNTTLEAYNHQEVPFEKVVEAVVKERDMSHSPLFQVMFTLQNTPEIPELKLAGVTLSAETAEDTTSKFDISLNLVETADGLVGGLTYNTDLFKAQTMARMIGHFTAILQAVVKTPTEVVGRINLLSAVEEEEQLKIFNATDADYPTDKSLLDIFEQQVAQTPDAVAVTFEEEVITYKQLNDKATSLAKYLQANGVKNESIIPVCTERSIEMIIGILGVMKTGGVYVPLDPEYPQDRIDYMLKDTEARLVVSSSTCSSKFAKANIQVVELDKHWAAIEGHNKAALNISVNAEQLAYIIYTSGSTGRPKGVMVEHRSVVNLVLAYKRDLNLQPGTRFLQFASFGFDASCVEIFSTLLTGGCLVMCTKESLLSTDGFEQLLTRQRVEIAILPPAFQPFIENMPDTLKIVLSAGEALNEAAGKHLQSKGIILVNGYGPTESTVCASQTHNPIRPDGIVTIGKPIDNVKIYILNKENQLSPVGVTGEICVGGIQVARGYLNQPGLTNEKFIKDPFSKDPGARLYRTGDLGRWLPDGDIEYLGRMDDQVKIRGYRIELGEIENVLLQSGLVSQAIILAKPDVNGINSLISYVTTEGAYDRQALVSYLSAHLPEYMVPKLWVLLDKFPVTTHGKINKRALPDVDTAEQLNYNYIAPRNKTEEGLAAIWQRLLGIDRVSIHDNFFELGGHSILAMRLIAAVKKEMAINITIRDLFIYPTIAKLYRRSQNQNVDFTQSLIPIKTTGNKIPLYIVCGAGGTAFKFKEFVKLLDPEQPVYGLQQPLHISDPADFPGTIEGIAERYVAEMLLDNPYGPYALAGHCLGGMIAVEMASQLQAMGKKISMLAMFDAEAKPLKDVVTIQKNNSFPSLMRRSVEVISTKVKFELFLLMKHPKQAVMYKARKIGPLFSNAESKLANVDQDIFDKITLQIKTAADNYKIKPYNGEIVLFNATQQYYFIDRVNKIIYKELEVNSENKHAWKNYAQSVKVHEVKGEHSTIFDEQNAREFSEILQHYLS
ncbi:non-ribosomal peptide synthase/polyketide synthase [Mucilaginibacter sp. SMC90]|uniref:non-ribosomal peptide synthase/polyketide synthase n=1 Tax=Mucilaginibacter sp. SMC90 TaxID=2929803 RepID=UPI001FB2EF7F|nr:non-ribosomal peptide synthase/polyketide synthase [Mucilaginibacter sp. SMC90]UOE51898.1 non-ribosomal peptide synthase/polyketide synthase [Mucilaginibacter sp. SMC90]